MSTESEQSPKTQGRPHDRREQYELNKQRLHIGKKSETSADTMYDALSSGTDELLTNYALREKDLDKNETNKFLAYPTWQQVHFKESVTNAVHAFAELYKKFPDDPEMQSMIDKAKEASTALAINSFAYAMPIEWRFTELNKSKRMREAKVTPEAIANNMALTEAIKAEIDEAVKSGRKVSASEKFARSIRLAVLARLKIVEDKAKEDTEWPSWRTIENHVRDIKSNNA